MFVDIAPESTTEAHMSPLLQQTSSNTTPTGKWAVYGFSRSPHMFIYLAQWCNKSPLVFYTICSCHPHYLTISLSLLLSNAKNKIADTVKQPPLSFGLLPQHSNMTTVTMLCYVPHCGWMSSSDFGSLQLRGVVSDATPAKIPINKYCMFNGFPTLYFFPYIIYRIESGFLCGLIYLSSQFQLDQELNYYQI